jgi:hypothetical protein
MCQSPSDFLAGPRPVEWFNHWSDSVPHRLYQMLFDFHNLCDEFQIEYWIAAGTALGAARHRGLIPWDGQFFVCVCVCVFVLLSVNQV